MKTSHKILVFAGIVPVLTAILTVFYVKNILEDTGDTTDPYIDSHPRVTKEVLVKDFSKISTDGIWRIHVIQGDDFTVELEAPEKSIEDIKLEKSDDMFHLHGMTNLGLSGFDSEAITIDAQDVSTISGKDSMIQQLTLTGNGILLLDMYDTTVTNAHIDYNGLYNVKMAIAGGRLSGQISGIGTLHCRGDIGVNDIEVISPGRMVFTE